jgi:hypothetical protein
MAMSIDTGRLQQLIRHPFHSAGPRELRRSGNIMLIGSELPARDTVAEVFDSHGQTPLDLFHLVFPPLSSFHQGEELVTLLKKNFSTPLMARIDWPPPPYIMERAYAAGVDILDIPLWVADRGVAHERKLAQEERLQALIFARQLFPKWGVVSTLIVGEEPSCSTISGIDTLLSHGIVPLVELSPRAARYRAEEISQIYLHLKQGWHRRRVSLKALRPLLNLATPYPPPQRPGVVAAMFDKFYDSGIRASSDLRRLLKVRQVEDSYESAAL